MRTLRALSRAAAGAAAVAALLAVPAAHAAVTIAAGPNTVTTPRFAADFGDVDVEQLHALTWAGMPSLALVAEGGTTACGDAAETWGQSYADPAPFATMAGAGSRGLWQDAGGDAVRIDSQITAAGCDGYEGNLPVRTTYRFFDGGPQADEIAMTRTLGFGPEPADFTQRHLRPYVPRLPSATFGQVLAPVAGALSAVDVAGCPGACVVSGWDGTWFAQHDPAGGGRGLLVLRDPATVAAGPARLLVDNDAASASNDSSADLLPPPGGWAAPVTETEYLCFYDASTWPAAERAALRPPAWCGPPPAVELSIADASVREGDGDATLTVTRSAAGVPAPRFSVLASDGTATAGSDYGTPVAAPFEPGATTTTVTVPIDDDIVHEGDEAFTVALTGVAGARVAGPPATVRIADDDAEPGAAAARPEATTTAAPAPGGAPPPAAPVLPAPVAAAASPLRAADLIALPAARACVSRRSFRIRLRQPRGVTIAKAVVTVDGKVVRTVAGRRLTAPVDLRGLPRGRFTVAIAVTTSTGAVLRDRRAYRTCAARRTRRR